MTHHWIGVASRDHVLRGVAGGFCQLGHGKHAPVKRMASGDWIVYYSPRTSLEGGEPVQAFTALGRIKAGDAYEADMGIGFMPWRRDVAWVKKASEAPIRSLLDGLELTRGKPSWGMVFRRSSVKISAKDFHLIAQAMGAKVSA
ncbi:MAG: EVE domain-containing protein [Casimicrobiaceae bacterium]